MDVRDCLRTGLLLLLLVAPSASFAQNTPAAKPPLAGLNEQQIRDFLIFNSPWESRSTTPGQVYRYRTNFVLRGQDVIAQVIRYATNEQGDSLVSLNEGRVVWQDTNGASVAVAVNGEDLVGTATSKTTNFTIVFTPRP